MARKIKFALEMKDGAKVRNSLEELREHFDLEKAVGYFLSGKLTEWLEDRYYEDEAEALDAIDKDAPDLRARLCEALGVECADDEDLDVAALERLNEKKAILRQKTSDESIIANADKTALTQEDLADLLDMDEPVIYLCGDNFNIPARVKNKKYVGVLGAPIISIKANSQEELNAKGIVFENVKLPWGKQNTKTKSEDTKSCPKCGAENVSTAKFCNSCGSSMDAQENPSEKTWAVPKTKMKALFAATFRGSLKFTSITENDAFYMDGFATELTQEQKALALSLVCDDKYTEDDLILLRISQDMTQGWAFTKDSFCILDPNYADAIITPYESALLDDPEWFSSNEMENDVAYRDMLHTWIPTKDALRNYLKNMKALFSKKKI